MHKRPYTSASSMEPSVIRPRRCYRLYEFPILWRLRRTAAPSNDLRCDAYQLEKLKLEQIQMLYLCDDGSVVYRKDSLHMNTCRYKYGKRSAPSNDLRYDAYQLEKLAGTNTDVVPMRQRKRCTWGRQSTTNTYVGTNYGKRRHHRMTFDAMPTSSRSKLQRVRMLYLCDDRSVVHRDNILTNDNGYLSVQLRKTVAPLKYLRCDA